MQVTRQHSRVPPLAFVRTLLIKEDLQWQVYVEEHLVPAENGVLVSFSERLDTTSISTAISTLQNANICRGNYDQHALH